MNNTLAIYAPTGSNTIQGIWKPISNSNTIGKAGLLVKVVAGSAAVSATDIVTFTAQPTAGDTLPIGGVVYKFVASLTGAANEILNGANLAAAIANLKSAINATTGSGSTYGTGTVKNPYVSAGTTTGTTLQVTALAAGASGNTVAVSSSSVNAAWASATLAGGVDPTANAPTNQASIDLPSAFTDCPTDILLDDGSQSTDSTNAGKFVSAAPLDAFDQYRLSVVLGGGAAGDILVPAPAPNYGYVAPAASIPASTGTAARRFQALEAFQPGQQVLVRRYPGTQTF